jgi:hypothetical protein
VGTDARTRDALLRRHQQRGCQIACRGVMIFTEDHLASFVSNWVRSVTWNR